jgi:hypothetical protein
MSTLDPVNEVLHSMRGPVPSQNSGAASSLSQGRGAGMKGIYAKFVLAGDGKGKKNPQHLNSSMKAEMSRVVESTVLTTQKDEFGNKYINQYMLRERIGRYPVSLQS